MKNKEHAGYTKHPARRARKPRRADLLKIICWAAVPLAAITLLILDALAIYTFTVERLTVLGICLLVVLLPFFSEIKVKELALKRGKEEEE